MNIAIVGCGFVADFYMKSVSSYPTLKLLGAYDLIEERMRAFCDYHAVKPYDSLEEILSDPSVELVLNLTNPRSHFYVTRSCLEAGKHVYSEKPLAMDTEKAEILVELAKQNQVYLGTAPCSLLGETAQTIWKAIQEGVIGNVRLVCANFDEGMIAPNLKPWLWKSESGAPWPAKDEFEVGCTYEHAGYFLTWLAAFFGPAKKVTAFASCRIADKGIPVETMAPDFTAGCIEYDHDIVARVTCSIVAPIDKSLTIIGDKGVIYTNMLRDDTSPVYFSSNNSGRMKHAIERRLNYWNRKLQRHFHWILLPSNEWRFDRRLPFARKTSFRNAGRLKSVDFCRGPAELAEAIQENRPCRLSAELGLHITELIEALQNPERFGGSRKIRSTFKAIQPLPWRC